MAEAVAAQPPSPAPQTSLPELSRTAGKKSSLQGPGFFTHRRLRLGTITLLIAFLISLALRARFLSLRSDAFLSGWVLLTLVLFLSVYNARKKLSFLPLGRSSTWLQLHIYAGLLSIIVFFAHSHGRLPHGPFETLLALLYLGTALSGVIGLVLTRMFPARLTNRGEQVLFERIPMFRRKLRDLAELTVRKSVTDADTTTLSDFYTSHAARFFSGSKNFYLHLVQSIRPRRKLLAELADLDRYLNTREREIAAELEELIKAKDDLDHQFALQLTLKAWLFVHIPLTYSLLLVAAVHLFLVHAFTRGGL